MNEFDNYFDYRDIGSDHYADYVIPAYLKKVLPVDKEARILDIGCGIGQLLHALRSEGFSNIAGVDVSSEAVAQCTAKQLPVERIDDLSAYCATGKRYDFIIMNHVIEHLPKAQIIDVLSVIRVKLLAEGGRLVITTPNAQANTGCYWAYEDFTHTVIFTAGSLSYVLRAAGFTQVVFLDPQGVEGSSLLVKLVCGLFLLIYRSKIAFWNMMTRSAFHRPSPRIFTYELKVLAG